MKKIIIISSVLIILSGICFLLNGCGGSANDVIATINGYELTTKEFNSFFDRMGANYLSAEDEYNNRRELVDSLINKRLLIQAAYEKNIDKSQEIARIISTNKERFLLDILFTKNIAPYIEPTETEIIDFHNNLEFKYRASHILVSNIDTANALLERIKAGENFEKLAFDYSIDPSAKRNNGDLGFFLWGTMVDDFQKAILKMQPGEISPPVKTQFGFHIIKLISKQPNDNRQPLAQMKDYIENQLKRNKAFEVTENYFNTLKDKYPVIIDTNTCQYLLHKRENMYPPQILATLPKNDFDPKALDRDEKELVLATIDQSQMTIFEYITQIQNISPGIRPDFDNYDSLAAIIFEMKKQEILALEAVREGYDNDPEYLEKMRLFKEMNMAVMMQNDSLPQAVPPSEDEIRLYYDEHIEEFTTNEKVSVHEILLSDELLAQKLVKEIKSLKEFKSKAEDLTERPGFRPKSGNLGYFERSQYPEIFDLARKTAIGGIGGPVVTEQKYSIFYVIDKMAPQVKDFLGVKKIINDKLFLEKKNEVFENWLLQRKENSQIIVNEDAIWSSVDESRYQTADTTTN